MYAYVPIYMYTSVYTHMIQCHLQAIRLHGKGLGYELRRRLIVAAARPPEHGDAWSQRAHTTVREHIR